MALLRFILTVLLLTVCSETTFGKPKVLDDRMYHLRMQGPREWAEFAEMPDAASLEIEFTAIENKQTQTLRLRQQDVKQRWQVRLNDKSLGTLNINENDMVVYFDVPAKALKTGTNRLVIDQTSSSRSAIDDIRVGEVRLDTRPPADVLSEAIIEIRIVDTVDGKSLPSRITILDDAGTLHSTGAKSNDYLAVRPGTVYTSTGRARIGLPAGSYHVYGGRGFEYSLASEKITVAPGEVVNKTLRILREVPTDGYIACDTHVHTLTHSGHGDATVQERMITLAAEGIELDVATDHNVHINHTPFAREMNVNRYFTSVVGNEFTTKVGHFNIFPVPTVAKPPNHRLTDWSSISKEIQNATHAPVVILNHGRDVHSGVRPLGVKLFNALVGEHLDGRPIVFNAMEVLNSSATQNDVMQLFHDWMGLLNRGYLVSPVGSSDSHDVSRHFVGQGRTYIHCDDRDPGQIDVGHAVKSFQQGKVMVSYGLLTQLTIAGQSSGDLVSVGKKPVEVNLRVLGPRWISADRIELFANGIKVREAAIARDASNLPLGVKWQGRWLLEDLKHDVHLVAIAQGPGVSGSFWKTAKPYQPTSINWTPRVIGCSGALWLDVDGDGRKTSARGYAERVFEKSQGRFSKMVEILAGYDRSIAAHAAHLYQTAGHSLSDAVQDEKFSNTPAPVRQGVLDYLQSVRANERAQFESQQ